MKIALTIFITLFTLSLSAQTVLTPEDAISVALKNNFQIQVAHNDADIARINNTLGNAGMLPNIAITASDNYSQNNANLQLSNGSDIKKTNADATNISANAALTWTLFDGGKMFVTKRKLNEIEALGKMQFKEKVQQTVFDVIVAYYEVVKQKQQLASINQIISYNNERVKILQTSFQIGLSPKTNLLQAKIDLNVYLENAINQESVIVEARRTLNQLLARDSDIVFEVVDSIPLSFTFDKSDLMQKLYISNTSIMSYQKQVDIAKLSIREFNAMRLPKITFNAGYNLLQVDNPASNITKNHTYGSTIGAAISVPLYQAGNAVRQVRIAKVQLLSAEYNLANSKMQINSQLMNAFTDYENQQKLLVIEEENTKLAKENLEISMERLRLGQTTSLELRQAQESFEEAMTRLLNFQYSLKVSETKLRQLMANL